MNETLNETLDETLNETLDETLNEEMEKKAPRSFSTYILVWLGLLVLTGVTITVAGLNLGTVSVLGAILIATIKSTLVVLYFMHIKYEDRVFKMMLGVAIFTLAVILLLTFADVSYR